MRIFLVRMPSGVRYWTVVDAELAPMPQADRFLRDLRFSNDRAESTTKAYATAVVLFLRWCDRTGRDWRVAAGDAGLFIIWLQHAPADPDADPVVVRGPGAKPVRGARRINVILTAVRGFLSHGVRRGEVPADVLQQIYELADARDLPFVAQGEDGRVSVRLRAQHRLHEPETAVDRATDLEVLGLLQACLSARDRLIVLLMARAGLRRGEVVGLRRADLHLLASSRVLNCRIEGSHLHVVRRENENGAWAKSRESRAVPADFLLVQAIDQYGYDRQDCVPARDCDFLLVNLFRAPLGAPMPPDAVNELIEALCRRAGMDRMLTPHMLRHAFASNIADSGGSLDEIQTLLGHSSPESARPYLHPAAHRMRAAVDRVESPRLLLNEVTR